MATGEQRVWSPIGGFSPGGGPTIDDLARCVHCGLCLNACPTQRITGLETESPRGRIYLMRAVRDGRIDITESVHRHMDLCLVCRACETACPSGVRFGRLMEATRADLWRKPVGPPLHRLGLQLAFEWLFPHRRLFRAACAALRLYDGSGLRTAVRSSGVLTRLPAGLAERERLVPSFRGAAFRGTRALAPRQAGRPRVGFVSGCLMSEAFGDVQRASVRVLEAFGCQVVTPAEQPCCGALNVHAGERRHAARMARGLIDAMLGADVDAVVINSAGCGSVMKEYHDLLAADDRYAPRVRLFEAKVRDFSELLVELPAFQRSEVRLRLSGTGVCAVYQDACHLRHAQRVVQQPRALLERIQGLTLVELSEPDQCCGSAGVYNLLHPAMSRAILEAKIADIQATGAEQVITANPGCILQLEKGLRELGAGVHVRHIASVLDEALGRAA